MLIVTPTISNISEVASYFIKDDHDYLDELMLTRNENQIYGEFTYGQGTQFL